MVFHPGVFKLKQFMVQIRIPNTIKQVKHLIGFVHFLEEVHSQPGPKTVDVLLTITHLQ